MRMDEVNDAIKEVELRMKANGETYEQATQTTKFEDLYDDEKEAVKNHFEKGE